MTTQDPTANELIDGFLEALFGLRPIPNDAGFAFIRGEDIPGADAAFLRRIVALRDLLLGIEDYLRVCGGNGRSDSLLIRRGDLAQQELEGRHEWPYYGPLAPHRAPWGREVVKPEVKDKKEPRRRRGQIPDLEVGAAS